MKELEGKALIDKQLSALSYEEYKETLKNAVEFFEESEILIIDRHINAGYFPSIIAKYAQRYKKEEMK